MSFVPSHRSELDPSHFAAYQAARALAVEHFCARGAMAPLWRDLTHATDGLLKALAVHHGLTVIAVGGYGRRELFPYSDVDVLVLLPEGADASMAAPVIAALQQCWDLRIPVSHAVHSRESVVAAAKRDHALAASLMDARLVAGERSEYRALKRVLQRGVFGAEKRVFVEAKLRERDLRHEKWGHSRFLLEPHIKEGKGALRDLQTLSWLARYCYGLKRASELVRPALLAQAEWEDYRAAYRFFATVRAWMHCLTGRAEERLTFDLQLRIAERMGYEGATGQRKAEQLMAHYFAYTRHVGHLTRIFCAVLEEEHHRIPAAPFAPTFGREMPPWLRMDHGRLQWAEGVDVVAQPALMVGLFAYAHRWHVPIHPRAYLVLHRALPSVGARISEDPQAHAWFMEMLLRPQPHLALHAMNEADLLAAVIPEFAGISGQMQYDGYHTYTVDEHTLMAVRNLAEVEAGRLTQEVPLSSMVAKDIQDRVPLFLAVLCHDLAKGTGGQHAEKGGEIAQRIALRMGCSPAQAALTGWLVEHHQDLSAVAFKRDLRDPQTLADFVHHVQSPERLRLLLLVTVSDIMAVGPRIWNGWKGALLRDLYYRASRAMGVEHPQLAEESAPPPPIDQAAHAAWVASPDRVACAINHDAFRAITQMSVCMGYRPDGFRLLCGVMAAMGASIASASVQWRRDGALAVRFGIHDGQEGGFAQEGKRFKALRAAIDQALAGTLDVPELLARRRVVAHRSGLSFPPTVYCDHRVSAYATVIEVNARDRVGLLYAILGALEAASVQVTSAHIATYGEKAVDVFYVKDVYGLQITHPMKLAEIQQRVAAAIAE